MAFNLVELATTETEDCAFDQPCKFGHRVQGHAVYCHNDNWEDSPRKCRRSWYTAGEVKDEDCAGFEPNPDFKTELKPAPVENPICKRCGGNKRIGTDRGKTETCPVCMGSGSQPSAIDLTQYEQDTLEMGTGHGMRHDTAGHRFVRIAKTDAENASIDKLLGLDLVVMLSISFVRDHDLISVYMLENTLKGEAVMRANWKAQKK